MREILFNGSVDYKIKGLAVNRSVPHRNTKIGDTLVPHSVRGMVCPHKKELHLVVISRLKETVIKALLKEGLIIVPIPVVNKDVYAVACCRLYLHFHNVGISLVYVSLM